MPSKLDLPSAVMLCALLLCAHGAPFGDASINGPEVDSEEGDTEGPSDMLRTALNLVIGVTQRHQKEFEDEFLSMRYDFLDHYKIPSLPEICPLSDFSKEACFRRLLQGLQVYAVLLEHVGRECPSSSVPTEAGNYIGPLITEIRKKMRDPGQVTVLTSSQEEQLLRDVDDPNTFQRKMMAHSILHHLHYFLIRGKRVINKRESPRRSRASRGLGISQFE